MKRAQPLVFVLRQATCYFTSHGPFLRSSFFPLVKSNATTSFEIISEFKPTKESFFHLLVVSDDREFRTGPTKGNGVRRTQTHQMEVIKHYLHIVSGNGFLDCAVVVADGAVRGQ